MWLVSWRTFSVSNRVSIQDAHIVGLHSPQFPLGGERTAVSFSTSLLETIIRYIIMIILSPLNKSAGNLFIEQYKYTYKNNF